MWCVGLLLLTTHSLAELAERRDQMLIQQEVESAETTVSSGSSTVTPGLGPEVTDGAGATGVALSSGSAWLDGTDVGLDSTWNAALIAMRKQGNKQNLQNQINALQQQVYATNQQIASFQNRLHQIDVIRGEVDILSNSGAEPGDVACDDMSTSQPNTAVPDLEMAADLLPDPRTGSVLPVPAVNVGPHFLDTSVVQFPNSGEGGESNSSNALPNEVDSSGAMNVPTFSATFAAGNMARYDVSLSALDSDVTFAAQTAHNMLTAPSTNVFSFNHADSTDLNDGTVWALMNEQSALSDSGKVAPEVPVAETDMYPSLRVDVEGIAEADVNVDIAPEDILGCCFTVTYQWLSDLSNVLMNYQPEDQVKAGNCLSGQVKKIHIPGAMCSDVKDRFQSTTHTSLFPPTVQSSKLFLLFLSQYATPSNVSAPSLVMEPQEIVPGQPVVPIMTAANLNALPLDVQMNMPIKNGQRVFVPPSPLRPKQFGPSVATNSRLFSKLTGLSPQLELTPSTTRFEVKQIAMPDSSAYTDVVQGGSEEAVNNVMQPSSNLAVDYRKRIQFVRPIPVAPTANGNLMPEAVMDEPRVNCDDLAARGQQSK